MHFLDVPAGNAFRPMIRIYDFDARRSARFVVRIHDFRSDDLISEQSVVTVGHAHTLPPGEPIDVPAYVQLSVDPPAERVRIEIESVDGARFWAMVSVTSNETQLVTLVLPQ